MSSTPNTFHSPQRSHHEYGARVGADRREQPMAGRQVERAGDAIEAAVPAGGRHGAAAGFLARDGGEIELRLAQLDSGAAVGAFGHEQLIVVLARALQRERRLHVEPPVAAHDARGCGRPP